jgi:hypothetical protein
VIQLQGQPGELRFTVQITRKESGKVEEVELVGFLDKDKLKELQDANETSARPVSSQS